MKLHVITNSELSTFRACQAKHHYAYVLNLRPEHTATPLRDGDVLHAGAEAGWRAAWAESTGSIDERLARALAAVPEAIAAKLSEAQAKGDIPSEEVAGVQAMAVWAVSHYFRSCRNDLAFVPLMIEQVFAVRIPNKAGQPRTLEHNGKIDLVLWDQESNRILVEDHKGTGSAVQSLEPKLPMDTQLSGYVMAVRVLQRAGLLTGATPAAAQHVNAMRERLAAATTGSIAFNVMRRSKPHEPNVNLLKKNQANTTLTAQLFAQQNEDGVARGEVSVAKIDTTAEVYAQALEEQFFARELPITEKQRELCAALKVKGDTYFAKLSLFRGDGELERWRQELWIEARRIREVNRTQYTRNPAACAAPGMSRCVYASLCMDPSVLEQTPVPPGFRVASSNHEELEQQEDGQEESETHHW